MHRSRTAPVPATRARIARRATTMALGAVAVMVPVTAHARLADSAAPSAAARPVVSAAAPRAVIAITRLAPGSLAAVAATSATNAWAVGNATPAIDSPGSPLILHWNGTTWTRQATPALPANSALFGVAARSPSDAWAVANASDLSANARALILHWNGAAWSRVATPSVGPGDLLTAVAMLSPTNVWAVGGFIFPLVLHWNGHVWKRVRVPKLPKDFTGGFSAVAAASPRSVWAVGSMTNCGCGPGSSLVMHWNGRSWKRQRMPVPSGRGCCFELGGVAATSSRRALAVGAVGEGISPTRAQAARFNGRSWRLQHTPSPGFRRRGSDGLGGIVATSSANAWAVGATFNGASRVLVERWNGRAWHPAPVTVSLAPAVAHADRLSGVTATSRRNAWAVGVVQQTATNAQSALILHWNGASWSPVPTAP